MEPLDLAVHQNGVGRPKYGTMPSTVHHVVCSEKSADFRSPSRLTKSIQISEVGPLLKSGLGEVLISFCRAEAPTLGSERVSFDSYDQESVGWIGGPLQRILSMRHPMQLLVFCSSSSWFMPRPQQGMNMPCPIPPPNLPGRMGGFVRVWEASSLDTPPEQPHLVSPAKASSRCRSCRYTPVRPIGRPSSRNRSCLSDQAARTRRALGLGQNKKKPYCL